MKIGILTFHNADNYGAVLQCLALSKFLGKLGHEVEVLNYKQPFIEKAYKPWRKDIILSNLTNIRLLAGYFFKVLPQTWKRHNSYQKFRKAYLDLSLPIYSKDEFPPKAAYIIGSDQVWSDHCTGGDDDVYWGNFNHSNDSIIIGYAISSTLSSLKCKSKDQIIKRIHNFSRLSFREREIGAYFKKELNFNAPVVLDPTLLPLGNYWESFTPYIPTKDSYILTYFLHEEKNSISFKQNVRNFANVKGLRVVDIFDVAHSPLEFLSYIRKASIILTTSFHATVFSIIYHKEFFSINSHDGREHRYRNLLNSINLQNRFIENIDILINNTGLGNSKIEYTEVNNQLSKLQSCSVKFLIESLK